MPQYQKPAKNSGAPKSGSRSPKHRGYRPDAAPAPKKRWTADDRAARTGDRPANGKPAREDRRPDWTPREKPARQQRDSYGDRGGRPAYGDRTERPAYGDRTERPSYGDRNPRADRPSYGDRSERPAYGDRPQRADRPSYGDRPQRGDRPAYGDRPQRGSYDRAPRRDGDDRAPRRNFDDRAPRRDFEDRAPRRSYDDRAPRRDFEDRAPRRDFEDRAPRRNFEDRAPRRNFDDRAPRRSFDDRAPRRDSSYYPQRDTKSFTPQDDVVLERLEASAISAGDVDGKTFADLGLGGNIVRQLGEMGAAAPFPIQAATIPVVLSGRDVLGRGKTGSGKTIAFGAPVVERLMENNGGRDRKMGRAPRALILAPTRELAQQIDRTVQPIARSVGLFTTTIVGGVPQHKQVGALQRGVDIVIATPGRVEDLVEQGRLDLSNVFITVLDEADHMCDLGFLEPVQRILRETKPGGQKLLFSATLDKGVATLVDEFLVEPSVHEVAGEDQASSTIDHRVFLIEQRDKRAIIEQLAGGEGKTLVFTRTRAFAEELSDYLEDSGIPATSLHGDLNQSRRTRNLSLLTSGRVNVLVATDVAARGIHVDDISLVIQADAPEEYKTYLHRSGRTGRAGKQGTVVTLVGHKRRRKMDELLGRAEIEADVAHVAPGDELLDTLAAL
ncbi:superfamily II DNA/RNA helicase [Microbacteriaceae bacterium SG_E_30_P1]|uniref:Superfamily II DNA/RNA helicase n=1 Tax=Antiquaquibacter oligotrophicus TaxID=2880260 RepID=A0ABT6KRR3_9MICO|nr:DEAD/DEAH box helicase [Antiquaquibacter oligotrophicus]MDH6182546.1 superfamily II DNA/RNA helicase [Antiquaquibacter oligotrophicus]UDF14487.1 DEAD/DEAH box helicase [Antiquaquibacter oligotrophicus]